MSDSTKTVVLLSGSPKAAKEQTLSEYLTDLEETRIACEDLTVRRFNVRQCLFRNTSEDAYRAMLTSDAVVVTFPLYFFCLPGLLMRFLQDYAAFVRQHAPEAKTNKIYAVVNCGFPEWDINEEAVRVVRSFARAVGAEYRFSLLIGGGGMILGARKAPFMQPTMDVISGTFEQIRYDILADSEISPQDTSVTVRFPRKLYFWMGNFGWGHMAKENGLKRKDLKNKPYSAPAASEKAGD